MKKTILAAIVASSLMATAFAEDIKTDCEFSWKASPSVDVVGYWLYFNGERETTEITTDLTQVAECKLGDFTVTAMNGIGIESEHSTPELTLSRPTQTDGLNVVRNNNQCNLTWNASDNPRLDGYTVTNGDTIIGENILETSLVVPCSVGEYSVSAITKGGFRSPPSAILPIAAPEPPTGFTISAFIRGLIRFFNGLLSNG